MSVGTLESSVPGGSPPRRPDLPFVPCSSYEGHVQRFTEPPCRHVIHHVDQPGGFIIRCFSTSVASTRRKPIREPTAKPYVETRERCKHHNDRGSLWIPGKQLDGWMCQVFNLQLGVKAVPLQMFN